MNKAGWTFLAACCVISFVMLRILEHEIREHLPLKKSETPQIQNGSHQCYLKIDATEIIPAGPNDTTTPFRIVAFVNGQQYGYPSMHLYVANQKESWPLPVGERNFQVRFEGFIKRAKSFAMLSGAEQSVSFNVSDLPKTNLIYNLQVFDTENQTHSTAVKVHFSLVNQLQN
jgi:hypothetical protein